MPKKGKDSSDDSKKNTRREVKAGLKLPVGKFEGKFRKKCPSKRLGKNTSIVLAASLEYPIEQVLKAAEEFRAKDNKHKRITLVHLQQALQSKSFALHNFYPANIGGINVAVSES